MKPRTQLDGAWGKMARLTCALCVATQLVPRPASAADLTWKGYTWSVTNGGMAGVAAGSHANVSVDTNGYLHLKIQKNGDTWTAAEILSSTPLGFGTYQWQIDGPIDTLDKNVVLGLFPYGPAAGIGNDGTNEIDIEYSRWGQENGPNGDWTNYPASGKTIGELSYTFSLSGSTLSTSRFIWTQSSIEDFLLTGLEPLSSTNSVLKSWKYAPDNAPTNIPQQALPLGMNLWCYDVPSDGKDVEIVVRDFQFVPESTSVGGAGDVAGSGSVAGGAGGGGSIIDSSAGTGGSDSAGVGGANSSSAGTLNTGGVTSGIGASSPTGGVPTSGTPSSAGQAQSEEAAGNVDTNKGGSAGCSVGLASRSARGGVLGWFAFLVPLAHARRRFGRRFAART